MQYIKKCKLLHTLALVQNTLIYKSNSDGDIDGALQGSAVQCRGVQCSAVNCSAVQCSSVQ